MGNSLNRIIKEGEVVVLKKDGIIPDYWDDRRVAVLMGFGMNHRTVGSTILVRWLSDGEENLDNGFNIDVEETRLWQEEGKFGRNLTPDPDMGEGSQRLFYVTHIHMTVVSDLPMAHRSIVEIANLALDGEIAMDYDMDDDTVKGREAVDFIYQVGSEPAFFRLDDDGNDLEDN